MFKSVKIKILSHLLCDVCDVAEVQQRQASLLQLQEETERQRALQEQTLLEKDSQLASVRAELLSQTQQLDGCQARVSIHARPHAVYTTADYVFQRLPCLP